MTDREIMQQALEALEEISGGYSQNLIVALRERLAQPEQWEQFYPDMDKPDAIVQGMPAYEGPLSKAQRTHWEGCEEVHPECRKPRREWVGLTVKEIVITAEACGGLASDFVVDVARAIEAKLKEKNT